MSHTTSIEGVRFTDVAALEAAVKELQSKGIKCDLVKGGTPRAYYQNQQGLGAAEYVLKLHDAKYDVGFYPAADGKGMEARTDLFAGSVAAVLGAVRGKGESAEMAALGKLNQTYAIHAATRRATMAGHNVTRVQQKDGTVTLTVTMH